MKGHAEFDIEADYYFAPTFLRGTPGQKLTLAVKNELGTLHNLSLPEQHLDKDILRKEKVTAEGVHRWAVSLSPRLWPMMQASSSAR